MFPPYSLVYYAFYLTLIELGQIAFNMFTNCFSGVKYHIF